MKSFIRSTIEDKFPEVRNYFQNVKTAIKGYGIRDASVLKDVFGEYWSTLKTKHTGYVAACLSTMGNYFAKAKFRVYEKQKGTLVEKDVHPFLDLLTHPNTYQTWWELKYFMGVYFGVKGNFYLLKLRGKATDKPMALIMLDPMRVTPKQKHKWIDYYEYNKGNEILKLKPEDVIHFRYPTPDATIAGKPIIDGISDILDVDAYQMSYMKKFYKEGGFLGNTFSTTQAMSKPSFAQAKKELQDKYGGSENSFKVALFEQGLQPIKAAYSIKDMELSAQRKLTLEEVMTAFRIPQILLGGSSDTYNRATATAAEYAYASTMIDPLLSNIDEVFTRHIQNDYKKNLVVVHDPISPKDVAENLDYYNKMFAVGGITINEIRKEENFGIYDYPLADVPLINVGGALIRLDTGEQIGQPEPETQSDSNADNTSVVEDDASGDKKLKSATYDLHWKQFNRRIKKDIKWLERRVGEFFDEQKGRLLVHLGEKNVGLVETFYEMEDEMVLLLQMIENGWIRFQERGILLSGGSGLDNTGRKDQFLNYSRSINETSKKQFIKRMKGGESAASIINDMYAGFKNRIPGIAETTAVSGFNAGLWLGYRSQGYTHKVWISQRDERVRDSHFVADNQKVKIDDPFIVGIEQLMYPGDPIASASEVIGCRCTLIGEK